ncbi:MAG: uridine kinase [Sandaracinus sp.]
MRPYVVGVAGGTGSGKTTVARKIAESLPAEMVTILEHDSYYLDRDDLTYEQRCDLNFDHPDSLETSLLVTHVRALKAGQSVEVPMYDFKIHRRGPHTRTVTPTPIVVVEGILLFSDPPLREELDLKLFVDTDADIRVLRRVRRDMEHRGRTFESVREQYYKTVRPMHLQFVEPSKRWADLIIPEGGNNGVALDLITSKVRSILAARG